MSKIIATAAIRGAHEYVSRAERDLAAALESHGPDTPVSLTDTAYYLPVIYALTGRKVQKLGELGAIVEIARGLLPPLPSEALWLPYLGHALDAGIATLFAEEMIETLKVVHGTSLSTGLWLGPTPDAILREQGIKLVDGRMPGFAACVGALPTTEVAVNLARDLQERIKRVQFMADPERTGDGIAVKVRVLSGSGVIRGSLPVRIDLTQKGTTQTAYGTTENGEMSWTMPFLREFTDGPITVTVTDLASGKSDQKQTR